MKLLITILSIMATTNSMAQNGKATTIKKTFSRQTSVAIKIKADPSIIWSLLTNAADFPRWNSTVISITGEIKLKEKIKLVSTLAPEKSFKLKVKEFEANNRMVWGDGKGNRIFLLKNYGNGTVTFSMDEKMGGLMFPLYAKFIPDFDEAFEQFAADLKKEAEMIQNTKN